MQLNHLLSRRRFFATSAALAAATPFTSALTAQANTCPVPYASTPTDIEPLDLEMHAADDFHREVLAVMPRDIDVGDIETAREVIKNLGGEPPVLPDDVEFYDEYVPGFDGHAIALRMRRPKGLTSPAPVIYWIHGGGLIFGTASEDILSNANLARELGAMVVSVEYRVAPEHPYPIPILDCYYGLLGLGEKIEEWGLDPTRIAVAGGSAGGNLAAALALGVRDLGGPEICFQFLAFPMLDDRNITHSSYAITDPRVWNRRANLIAWDYYLPDGLAGSDDVPYYAAPSRATDLSNLPPAYINVGSLDLFLDEDIDYAQRLLQARVPAELQVYPGAFHTSKNIVTASPLSQRWKEDEVNALRRGLKV